MSFEKPKKVWIGSIDKGATGEKMGDLSVEAQYNPGTLEVSQNVPWKKPDPASQSGGGGSGPPPAFTAKVDKNYMVLEFTGAEGRSIGLELLFDGVEDGTSVATQVATLEELAAVRNAGSSKEEERRPHHCVVVWANVLPRFKCVIESLTTKYTMFAQDGTPLRATCTLKLKEAAAVQRSKK
jgi:hypothetical protein